MFVRYLTLFGAASAFLASNSTGADAFGRYHRSGAYQVCYKKVVTPPVYKTVTQRVMVTPAACSQYRTPPTYGTVATEVVVQPSYQVVRSNPAVYGRVQVSKMVRPSRTRWVRRGCRGEGYKCAVTTPAKYRTRTKRVMVTPRQSWVETRPAVKQMVNTQVMLDPGKIRQVCQPAVYQNITRQVMVSAGSVQWVQVPNTGYRVAYRQPVQSYSPQPRRTAVYKPARRSQPIRNAKPLK